MRTYVAKGEEAEALKTGANWFVVDATNVVLGRLATKVARMLIGKDKPSFTPYLDSGDHVVVINADKVRMTGNKVEQKVYYSHSGYPGGLKEVPAKRLREAKADWMIREAVLGMLPKNKLRARRAKKLRIYRDAAGLARQDATEPLKFTKIADQVDVVVTAHGGGVGGQAGAVRMGLSRAISRFNPELRAALRKNGFLTRDSRMKERKKYGQKGARKRFQFTKR